MNNVHIQQSNPLVTCMRRVDDFLQSKYLIPMCVAFALVCWGLGWVEVAFGVMLSAIAYSFFRLDDQLSSITIFTFMLFTIPETFENNNPLPLILVVAFVFPFLIAGILYHYIKRRPKFVKSKLIWPTIVFCGAMLLSGLLSGYYITVLNWAMIANLVLMYMLIVFFVYNASNRLTLNYVMALMLSIAVLVALQTTLFLLIHISNIEYIISHKAIYLGWGVHNAVATILVAGIPAAFYFAHKSNITYIKALYIGIAVALFIVQIPTLSRQVLLLGPILLVAVSVWIWIKSDRADRIQLIFIATALLIALSILSAIFMSVFWTKVSSIFDFLQNLGFNDNDRLNWYRLAWDTFLRFPIFGAGFEYDHSLFPNNQWFFAIHNTPLQFLASSGLIGFVASVFFFGYRYTLMFGKKATSKHPAKFYATVAVLLFVVTGIVDLTMFYTHFILLVGIIFAGIELDNKQRTATEQPSEI